MSFYVQNFNNLLKPVRFNYGLDYKLDDNPYLDKKPSDNPYIKDKEFMSAVSRHYKSANNLYPPSNYIEPDSNRGTLSRVFDAISMPLYTTAGFVRGMVNDDFSPIEGAWSGLKASNPFGKGHAQGQHTYSRVLEDMGWQPETTSGKIARGVVGFIGDVMLDPLTYLTGGVSALARGTGKAGAKLTHGGQVAEEIAKRYNIDDISKGLSVADAKSIIIQEALRRGDTTLKNEDIIKGAEKFSKEFNKIIGLTPTTRDLKITLGGAPFGEKIFGRYSNVGITLGKAENIAQFGDKTVAPYYAKLRDAIYGSKLGERFSTITPLYRLSKTDPGAFYDFIRFVEIERGLSGDRLSVLKAIEQKAREINLTPDEQRKLIDLMENKTYWNKISETINYADTKIGRRRWNELNRQKEVKNEYLNSLLEKKKSLESLIRDSEAKIKMTKDALDVRRDKLREELSHIKIDEIKDVETLKGLIRTYNDEIKLLKNEISNYTPPKELTLGGLLEKHNLFKSLQKAEKRNFTQIKQEKRELVKNLSLYLHKSSDFISARTYDRNIDKLIDMAKEGKTREQILSYIEANARHFDGRAPEMYSFIGSKLGYGYGKKYTTWKEFYTNRVGDLNVKILKGTATAEDLRLYGYLQQQNFIRNQYLYKFNQAETMADLRKLIAEESDKVIARDFNDYRNAMRIDKTLRKNVDDMEALENKRIGEKAHYDMLKVEKNIDDATYETSFNNALFKASPEELSYLKKLPKHERFAELINMGHMRKEPFRELDSFEKEFVREELFKRINKSQKEGVKLTYAQEKYIHKVIKEVENLLKNEYKTALTSFTHDKRQNVYSRAMYNVSNNLDGVKRTSGMKKAEVKSAQEILRKRYNKARIEYLSKIAHKGAEVEFKVGDKTLKGIIDEVLPGEFDSLSSSWGKTTYNVVDESGVVHKIRVEDMVSVGLRKGNITPDELIQSSEITKNSLQRIDELENTIEDLTRVLKETRQASKNSYRKAMDNYKKEANEYKKHIKVLEARKQNFHKALKNKDFANIDKLVNEIIEIQEILATSDAFDSYMRRVLGDAQVDKAVFSEFGDAVKVVLKDDIPFDDKVKQLAQFLRNSFVEMAKEEVKIGKLKQEQVDNLIMEYLPHILTPEGARHFAKKDFEGKMIEGFGGGLGYGREFNPHAKSRTIKWLKDGDEYNWQEGFSINQINDYFKEKMGIKSFFQENVAEIYLARATKHIDLMYDDKYMRSMLEEFGRPLSKVADKDGVIKLVDDGYKAVMNYGMLKETIRDLVNFKIAVDMSEAVSEYLSNPKVLGAIEKQAQFQALKVVGFDHPHYLIQYKKAWTKVMNKYVDDFMESNYPKSKSKEVFEKELFEMIEDLGVGKHLDEIATPMVELDEQLIHKLNNTYDWVANRYYNNLKKKLLSYERSHYKNLGKVFPENIAYKTEHSNPTELRNRINSLIKGADEIDTERLEGIIRDLDRFETFKPPQIRQVNDAIVQKANQQRKVQIAKDQHQMLQLWDKVTHFIKLNQTTILPSFHVTNKLGNTFNNYLELGVEVLDPKLQADCLKAVHYARNNPEKLKDMSPVQIKTPNGEMVEMSWGELYNTALKYGAINDGFFAQDIMAGAQTRGLFKKFLPSKYDPTDTKNFIPYRVGAEIGGTIEGQDRLAHFVVQLRKGMSFEDAAASSKNSLFDYSDLTAFEQSVMKRIFPYYTWMRKNSAYQLEMMLENPKRYLYTSKILGGIEGMVDEDERVDRRFLPEFAKDWIQTPFSTFDEATGRTRKIMWNPKLPVMDLNRLPDPTSLDNTLNNILPQLNPLILVPIEQALNKNFFFDSPIVGEKDNQLTKRADHIARNYAPYGVVHGAVNRDGIDRALHLLNFTSGQKFTLHDENMRRSMVYDEIREKLAKETYQESLIRRSENQSLLKSIRRWLEKNK